VFCRPVIASDVGGMAERVRHEVGGLLFPMGDARALAATVGAR
jgi:glycosyltransferase involved in cell wall biosynthesis